MTMVNKSRHSLKPHTTAYDDTKSFDTFTEHTMSLDEDENMLSVSQHSEWFACNSSSEDEGTCSDSSQDDDIYDDIDESARNRIGRRIAFAPMAAMHPIISRAEYSRDEIEDSWWTPRQREVLNKAHNKTIDRLESGLKEKKSSPYRGLEKIAIEGYDRMVEAKNEYVDTVMDEQQRQWDAGDLDLDWGIIANLTQKTSRRSTQEALMHALYDENEAREAYQTIKVKDLFDTPFHDIASVDFSERSDIEGSARLEIEDDLHLDEDVGKLIRVHSSIRQDGVLQSKKKSKRKTNKDSKKKKNKSQSKICDEETGEPTESEVDLLIQDFADVFGGGSKSGETKGKKKKRSSSKSSKGSKISMDKSKNDSSGNSSAKKKKEAKKKSKKDASLGVSPKKSRPAKQLGASSLVRRL